MSFDEPTRADTAATCTRPLPLFMEMLRNETATLPDRRRAALAGLTAYQNADRAPPPPPLPLQHRHGRATLNGTGGTGRPVVLVPSLINPSTILDLAADRSLVRWLGEQGHAAWLLDWGVPTPADRDLDIAGHVEQLLLPLLARLDEPPVVIGYCLGGTMALAAAALVPRRRPRDHRRAVALCRLWRGARRPCPIMVRRARCLCGDGRGAD